MSLVDSAKEMGANDVYLWQAPSWKAPKHTFSILNNLLCVDPTQFLRF